MSRFFTLSPLLGTFLISACSNPPFLYRPDIHQGNLFAPEQVAQIQVGMPRETVHQILGTPIITDPYHANTDTYVFYFKSGKENRSYRRNLTIQYINDIVASKTETPVIIKND